MPAHNAGQFIKDAIDSVIQQSYEDWELLVINDGSTDNTASLARSYRDKRIRVIDQDHQGEAAARNRALEECQSEYVGFLDADDWLLPQALETFVVHLDDNKRSDVVYTDGYKCNAQGAPFGRFSDHRPPYHQERTLEAIAVHPIYGGVCSTAIRHKTLVRYRLCFDEAFVLATDWDFFVRLAEVAHFSYLDVLTCKYRFHQGSISAMFSDSRRKFHAVVQNRIVTQPYFAHFSPDTQYTLFYQLLIQSLKGSPIEQLVVMDSPAFHSLCPAKRAQLSRCVAYNYIIPSLDREQAVIMLNKAIGFDGWGIKERVIKALLYVYPKTVRYMLGKRLNADPQGRAT